MTPDVAADAGPRAGAAAGAAAPVRATPFHATPVTSPAPTRRLLIVSPYFAPSSDVGGLRWEKMARFAVERGWGVDVICFAPEYVPRQDPGRLAALAPNVRVFGIPWVRTDASPALTWVRALLRRGRRAAAPAAPGGAAPAAPRPAATETAEGVGRDGLLRPWAGLTGLRRAYFARRWMRSERAMIEASTERALEIVGPSHRVVISSGPPHFAHLAAQRIAARTGLPFVMDMRDPWSLAERYAVDLASTLLLESVRRAEAEAVRAASLVVCNTELAERAMREAHPAAASRMVTVMNGSDDDPPVVPPGPSGGPFTLAYAGGIYFDRTPRQLFTAVARVVRELGLGPDQLRVAFMGAVDPGPERLHETARAEGIAAHVVHVPPGPRAAAQAFMAEAAMLVSLPQDTETAIPSKVFEYAQFPAWLLALARPGSATARVLRDTEADVVAPDDVDALAAVIARRYGEFRERGRPRPVGADGRFSRRRQADVLFARLDALLGER